MKIMSVDTVDASQSSVGLNDTDIPGAHLDEPFETHNVAAPRWWLLCRGVRVPTSFRKHKKKLCQPELEYCCPSDLSQRSLFICS